MSEYGKLTVEARTAHGKGPARRIRAAGKVPGVVYGRDKDPIAITLDPRFLRRAMDPERRFNTMFELDVDGAAKETCVIADFDMDPLRDVLVHVDFMRVDPEGEVERRIPVTLHGRAAGVVAGGKLTPLLREVRVLAPAGAMPVGLPVDVTSLEIGQTLRVKDVSLHGATILEDGHEALATVSAPKAKVEEEAPAAEAGAAAPAGDDEEAKPKE